MANTEKTKSIAAMKAGMNEKTARKYLCSGKLPSQSRVEHTWQTRKDSFEKEWPVIEHYLEVNQGLEVAALFSMLQRENPGKFADGQLRTLQRKIKFWRGLYGPAKEVFFAQKHYPGDLCASDFTDMSKLQIKINGHLFKHLFYHFVLTYSNWETGTLCFSESYESLSQGFQNAIWQLGGVPKTHLTDRLSAAIHKECNRAELTERYKGLMNHYGISARSTQSAKAHENGDIEQRHYRFKKAVEQALLFRGSSDFESREEYTNFISTLFDQLNKNRQKRFQEELHVLRELPIRRLSDCQKVRLKVGRGSTINVKHNTYSVHSRLIGEQVGVRIYAEKIDIYYAQKLVESLPRLRGDGKAKIDYRHIIDWLIRKPGAFKNYRYRDEMFPGSIFRMAYDALCVKHIEINAVKEYLKILNLAAKESETKVIAALNQLSDEEKEINFESIYTLVHKNTDSDRTEDVQIDHVDLKSYDCLLQLDQEVVCCG